MKKHLRIRILVLWVGIMIASTQLFAQPKQGHQPPRIPDAEQIEKMVDKMSTELNLNDQQKVKMLGLFKAHFVDVEALMENHKDQNRSQRQEMETLRKQFETEVKKNLTEDQAIDFDEFRKNNRPQKSEQKQGK